MLEKHGAGLGGTSRNTSLAKLFLHLLEESQRLGLLRTPPVKIKPDPGSVGPGLRFYFLCLDESDTESSEWTPSDTVSESLRRVRLRYPYVTSVLDRIFLVAVYGNPAVRPFLPQFPTLTAALDTWTNGEVKRCLKVFEEAYGRRGKGRFDVDSYLGKFAPLDEMYHAYYRRREPDQGNVREAIVLILTVAEYRDFYGWLVDDLPPQDIDRPPAFFEEIKRSLYLVYRAVTRLRDEGFDAGSRHVLEELRDTHEYLLAHIWRGRGGHKLRHRRFFWRTVAVLDEAMERGCRGRPSQLEPKALSPEGITGPCEERLRQIERAALYAYARSKEPSERTGGDV